MLPTYERIIVLETTRQGQIWSKWYTGCWQPPSYLSGMQPRTSLYLHLEQVNTDPEQFYAMTCKHLSSHRKLWSHPTPDGVPSWFSSAPNTPDTPDVPEIAASLTRCGEVPTRGGNRHLSKNSFSVIFSQQSTLPHHVEASSSSSSSSCWGIIDVIKISAIQSLFRNISLSSNIVVLVIKAGIIILGTFSVAKFFRYRYQYFFPTPKFSGRGTFFPGPNFSVSGPILFLDQICPFTGSCSFFRTKFFRYRSRYFFSGPNFSRTGTSTIQKGAKFPGPGILRTGMSHSGW